VYFAGMDRESCPAVVCCGGRMDCHGAPLSRTWVKLGETTHAGDTTLSLAEPVTGWKAGDQIILTATHRQARTEGLTEERRVTAIDGRKVMLDQPLKDEHLGSGEYRGEVANLSRNVVVESADPARARGHTMYHRHSAGSIGYAELIYAVQNNIGYATMKNKSGTFVKSDLASVSAAATSDAAASNTGTPASAASIAEDSFDCIPPVPR